LTHCGRSTSSWRRTSSRSPGGRRILATTKETIHDDANQPADEQWSLLVRHVDGRIRAIYVMRNPDKLRGFLEHTHRAREGNSDHGLEVK